MKICIPTKGYVPRMSTIATLKKVGRLDDALFFVHTDEQRKGILKDTNLKKEQIVVHGIPVAIDALADVRDYLESTLKNSWYVGMDDNVQYIEKVVGDMYHTPKGSGKRDDYRQRVESKNVFNYLIDELIHKCERKDTVYGGFGWHENPFFRKKKWQWWGYCKAKLYVKRTHGVRWRWDPSIRLMMDHALSFKVIAEYGKVCINQFVYVHHERWQKGGLGTHEYRLPARNITCDFLYEEFQGLVGPRGGVHDNPALRKHSQKSIDKWRMENNYL